jgi:hypothetical protein
MKRNLLFLLVGLSACSSAAAPAGPPRSLITPTMLQPPPIYALLGHRERLELTSAQINGLDSIAVQLKEENDELIDELAERSDLARDQTALIVSEEGQPILEEIRDNNREASEAVGRLLTSTQQTTTCDIFELGDDDRRRGRDRPRIRGADPEAADSIWRMLQSRTWPWCGADSPAEADTARN